MADSVTDGAHAANNADPATRPAAFIKSRRERYCEYGVISDDLMGIDLYVLFMVYLFLYVVARAILFLPEAISNTTGDCFVGKHILLAKTWVNMSLLTKP
jgi:hypothetical protein